MMSHVTIKGLPEHLPEFMNAWKMRVTDINWGTPVKGFGRLHADFRFWESKMSGTVALDCRFDWEKTEDLVRLEALKEAIKRNVELNFVQVIKMFHAMDENFVAEVDAYRVVITQAWSPDALPPTVAPPRKTMHDLFKEGEDESLTADQLRGVVKEIRERYEEMEEEDYRYD